MPPKKQKLSPGKTRSKIQRSTFADTADVNMSESSEQGAQREQQRKRQKTHTQTPSSDERGRIVVFDCSICHQKRVAWFKVKPDDSTPKTCRSRFWKPMIHVEGTDAERLDFEPCDPNHPPICGSVHGETSDFLGQVIVVRDGEAYIINPVFLLAIVAIDISGQLTPSLKKKLEGVLPIKKLGQALDSIWKRFWKKKKGRTINYKWIRDQGWDAELQKLLTTSYSRIESVISGNEKQKQFAAENILKSDFCRLYQLSGLAAVMSCVKRVWEGIPLEPVEAFAGPVSFNPQKVFFLGETGKGKSTVLNALLAMSTPRFYEGSRNFLDVTTTTIDDRQDADNAHLQAYIEVKDKAVTFEQPQDFYLLPAGDPFGGTTPAPVEVKYSETFTIEFSFMAWEEIREEVFNVRINKKSLNDGEEKSFLLKRMKAFTRNDAKKEDNKDAKDESSSSDDDDDDEDDDDDDWETVTLEGIELAKELDVLKKNSNCSWKSILRYLEERGASVTTKWIEACWDEDEDEDEDDEISIGDKDSDDEMADGNEEEKEDIVDRPTVIFSGRGESLQQDRKLMQQILTDLLCQHPPLACSLKSIVVGVPSLLLQGGITLVDTPGANDGNEIKKHNLKKMLEKERDHCSALIITENMDLNEVLEDVLRSSGLSKNGRYAVMHNSELKGLSSLERAKQDWHENKKKFKKHRAGCAKKLRKLAGEEHDELDVYKERVITARPTLAASLSVSGDMWWSNCDNLLGLSDLLDKINKLSVDNWVAHADEFIENCESMVVSISTTTPNTLVKKPSDRRGMLEILEGVEEPDDNRGRKFAFKGVADVVLSSNHYAPLRDLSSSGVRENVRVDRILAFSLVGRGSFGDENSLENLIVPMHPHLDLARQLGRALKEKLEAWGKSFVSRRIARLAEPGDITRFQELVEKVTSTVTKVAKISPDAGLQKFIRARETVAMKAIKDHDKLKADQTSPSDFSQRFLDAFRLEKYRKHFWSTFRKLLSSWFHNQKGKIVNAVNNTSHTIIDGVVDGSGAGTTVGVTEEQVPLMVRALVKQLKLVREQASKKDQNVQGLLLKLVRWSILSRAKMKLDSPSALMLCELEPSPRELERSDENSGGALFQMTDEKWVLDQEVLGRMHTAVAGNGEARDVDDDSGDLADLPEFVARYLNINGEAFVDVKDSLREILIRGDFPETKFKLGDCLQDLLIVSSLYNLGIDLEFGESHKIRLLKLPNTYGIASVKVTSFHETQGFGFVLNGHDTSPPTIQQSELPSADLDMMNSGCGPDQQDLDEMDVSQFDSFQSWTWVEPNTKTRKWTQDVKIKLREAIEQKVVKTNVVLKHFEAHSALTLSDETYQKATRRHIQFTDISTWFRSAVWKRKCDEDMSFAAPHALAVVDGVGSCPNSREFAQRLLQYIFHSSLSMWDTDRVSNDPNRSRRILATAYKKAVRSLPRDLFGSACMAVASVSHRSIHLWGCGDCRAFILTKRRRGVWDLAYSSEIHYWRTAPTQLSSKGSKRDALVLDPSQRHSFTLEYDLPPEAESIVVLGSDGVWDNLEGPKADKNIIGNTLLGICRQSGERTSAFVTELRKRLRHGYGTDKPFPHKGVLDDDCSLIVTRVRGRE